VGEDVDEERWEVEMITMQKGEKGLEEKRKGKKEKNKE
jgi:hypothetical protein